MEEAFYHYQHPDYSSEATPIAAYLQRLWDMQTCKDYPNLTSFKKRLHDSTRCRIRKKDLRNFILHLFIHYQGPLEKRKKKKTDLLSMVYLLGDGTLPNGIFFKYHLGNNAAKSDFPRFLLPPRTG